MSQLHIHKYKQVKLAAMLSFAVIFMLGVAFLQPFSFSENTNAITERATNGDYYLETTSTDLNLTIETTPAGNQVSSSHDVTVKTDDPAGYTLTVSVNNDTSNALNLNGNTSATEKFAATSGTYDSPKALDENSWGFADTLAKSDSNQWAAVPLSSNAQQLKSTSSANTAGDTTTIYYAVNAKYDGAHSNGSYSNTITYSVVGNTIPVKDLSTVKYMHEATYDLCKDSADFSTNDVAGTTYELYDKRNEMPYYIRKFSDGNCWMVENLNLPGGTALDTTTSNVSYTLPASSTSFTTSTGTSPRMNNGEGRNRAGATYSSYAVDGAYYNWCAAVANQGGCYNTDKTVTSTTTSNICPKGWRLPISSENSTIASTVNTLGINYFFTKEDGSALAPTSPVYAGYRYNSALNAGSHAYWWSSTQGNNTGSYGLYALNGSLVTLNSGSKYRGYSVRCLLSSTTTP